MIGVCFFLIEYVACYQVFGFYNLFLTKIDGTYKTGLRIYDEQLDNLSASGLLSASSSLFVRVICAEADCPILIRDETNILFTHQSIGDEYDTLTTIWAMATNLYKKRQNALFYYIHSKGSFHNSQKNEAFRRALMNTVVGSWRECERVLLHDDATTCGMRFSPSPHAHFTGNMWWASGDYIATLLAPLTFSKTFPWDTEKCEDWETGRQRFGSEHWLSSAPHNIPFDCITTVGSKYLYGYYNIDTIRESECLSALIRLGVEKERHRELAKTSFCYKSHENVCKQALREMQELYAASLGEAISHGVNNATLARYLFGCAERNVVYGEK